MKPPFIVSILLLFICAGSFGQENYREGIVHGPKAGFNISAPEGWVVDNQAGVEQGMPCVLYPKVSSWADAKTVMYANMAGAEFEGVNAFVEMAIKEMKAKHGIPKEKIASGKTQDGHDYFVNEYPATKTYSQWERVGYVQLPRGVAFIVLSSRDHASYKNDSGALEKVLKTLVYLEPQADSSSPSAASASPMDARPSRFTSLTDAVAEAKRLTETEAGKLYDFDFNATVSNRLTDIVGQCAKDSKPLIFDLVFVFAGDGHVAQVLQPPDSTVAACVAAKLANLRLRAPPQPSATVKIP